MRLRTLLDDSCLIPLLFDYLFDILLCKVIYLSQVEVMAADPSPSPGPRGEDASPVDDGRRPGAIDAGFLPRGGTPAPGRGGFASGGALETCPPGPALAGSAEDATGPRRDYPGLTDDELIGSMLAWGKLESWAGAGKLSAMAELSRRRAATGREAATRGGIPTSWSKYCSDEIAAALALSRWAAGKQLDLADALATRLPVTRRALDRPGGSLGAAGGAKINLTIPLTTLLGLTDHPGEAAGFGHIDADLARTMAAQAAASPHTTWCITVTDHDGHPTAHGCRVIDRCDRGARDHAVNALRGCTSDATSPLPRPDVPQTRDEWL
jgi:hypothetical protein